MKNRPSARSVALGGLLALAAATALVWAEVPDRSPGELRESATHIVTGKVQAVYTREEVVGDWTYTHYLAEIAVETVETGDGLALNELVYVRYWRRQWTGSELMPPSTAGHRGLPDEGQRVRAHLTRNVRDGFARRIDDGGYNLVPPNGFIVIDE